ncbi:MAG: hypothetical protein PHV06_08345, partial [bacterium]|nr:hypothetical protein [bacterium]
VEAFNIAGALYPGTVLKADFEPPDEFFFKGELLDSDGNIRVSWEQAFDDGDYFGEAHEYRIIASTEPIKNSIDFHKAFLDQYTSGLSREFNFNSKEENIYILVIAYDDVYNHSPFPKPRKVILHSEDKPIVFPNPYKINSGAEGINFINLPSTVKIFNIYNISGELVSDIENIQTKQIESALLPGIEAEGYFWDLTNLNGEKIASGTYIFYVEDLSQNKFTGKFSVVK